MGDPSWMSTVVPDRRLDGRPLHEGVHQWYAVSAVRSCPPIGTLPWPVRNGEPELVMVAAAAAGSARREHLVAIVRRRWRMPPGGDKDVLDRSIDETARLSQVASVARTGASWPDSVGEGQLEWGRGGRARAPRRLRDAIGAMPSMMAVARSSTSAQPPRWMADPASAIPLSMERRRRSTRPSVYSSRAARAGTMRLASVRSIPGRTASGNERPSSSNSVRPSGRARMPGRWQALL